MKITPEVKLSVTQRWNQMEKYLDERMRRLTAASEAMTIGHGGIKLLSDITGLTCKTIITGMNELKAKQPIPQGIRKEGGGRKRLTETNEQILIDLEYIINPSTRGDPESPLLWTSKSLRKISNELSLMGYKISPSTVRKLLKEKGYSLQSNKKTEEGTNHPDRDAQFLFISEKIKDFMNRNQPVISVDTKKKELVGNFKNNGREYHKKGENPKVNVHDFKIKDKDHGKVNPYGIYDIIDNSGMVNVGVDHDTPAFAVASIKQWWNCMGSIKYPHANELLITADAGGSNGVRPRLWKKELQKMADEIRLEVSVCHLPPGTSKWNKIEHRLFSHISMNWRGRPLVSHEVIVNLIASTTTTNGLTVNCGLDYNTYPKGIKVTDKEMEKLNITKDPFHGEWNYKISPH